MKGAVGERTVTFLFRLSRYFFVYIDYRIAKA